MTELLAAIRLAGFSLILGISVIIVLKLLAGGISLKGVLSHSHGVISLSAGRAQLLVFTVFTAVSYCMQIVGSDSVHSLPNVPAGLLVAIAGSHTFYLVDKLIRMLRSETEQQF